MCHGILKWQYCAHIETSKNVKPKNVLLFNWIKIFFIYIYTTGLQQWREEKHSKLTYLASCKMLILKVSVKCSLTTYFNCFPTIFALAMQYPLVETMKLDMILFRHPYQMVKVGERSWSHGATGLLLSDVF